MATEVAAGPQRSSAAAPWRVEWYPLAVPAAYVLSIWSASLIHPSWLVRPLLLTVLASVGATLVLSLLAGDRHRGALAAWAAGIGLIVADLRISALLLAFAAALVVSARIARRPWRLGPTVSRALSALGLVLLLVSVVSAVGNGSLAGAIDDVRADLSGPRAAAAPAGDPPDIWLILLDGYPGVGAAERLAPDWDREAFPGALAARGFQVVPNSRTNYPLTRLVLPAMFNASHVVDQARLDPPFHSREDDARRLRAATDDSSVLRALAEAGYTRTVVSSGWAHLGLRRVDRIVDPAGPSELETGLLRASGLGRLLDVVAPSLAEDWHRDRIRDTLARASAIAAEAPTSPRFVFVHLPAPHPPLVYAADGTPRDGGPGAFLDTTNYDGGIGRDERIERTFANADHIARLALETIDDLLAASAAPPVIVVFSDHGSEVGWNDADPLGADLVERMSNILAVHAPGHTDLFPEGTTPVNVFPLVLNAYLDLDLAAQPDSHWAWPANGSILDLVELDPTTWRPR